MDSTNTIQFLEEAENSLTAIRGSILVFVRDGKSRTELETPMRRVQTLKASAYLSGMEEIGGLAERLETELESLLGNHAPLSGETPGKLLDILAAIETGVVTAKLAADDYSMDISDFIDESFDYLRFGTPGARTLDEPQKTVPEPIEEDEFEIDEEMVEVFREEADELLGNIRDNLGILANEPNNQDALLEIRRSAHTFKGSAGIVGLKKPSLLAHRVEDLLDYLAENEIRSNEKIFTLLLASTDCLVALTLGEDSPQLEGKVAGIYRDFDDIMAFLTAQSPAPAPPARDSWTAGDKPAAIVTPAQAVAQQNRPVVRVSLEKLDDLASIVRGLVTSRSVFEQRLAEFELQVQELHNTTRRLQRSSSKLETDFESNMLNHAGSGAQLRALPASLTNSLTDNEFDLLEFDRYTEFHQTTRELLESTSDNFAINSALDTLRGNFEGLFENQRRLIEDMQERLQRIRMIEFGTLSARLSRTVRVTCEEEEKQADLFIDGENLEVDTQILDSLIEPLMHLLRNAVAHGIESPDTRRLLGKPEKGRVDLVARNEETHIAITISDDGGGVTTAALKEKAVRNGLISQKKADSLSEDQIFELMFQPGLTTAETVRQTAGRGVGMNIVRTSIERQQGTVSVTSDPQKGTSFTLRLPISMVVTRVLLVKANRQTFAFPLKLVKEIKEIAVSELEKASGEKSIRIENSNYPLADLSEQLGFPSANSIAENLPVLLLDVGGRQYALIVDEVTKPEEIMIKPLGRPLENLKGVLGATILGNGQVVSVLDMAHLLKPRAKRSKTPRVEAPSDETRQIYILVVDDSPSVRHVNTRLIQGAGWNAVVAKDGLEAIEMLQAGEKLPDVILSDVEMPRMDGYELLASLKKNDRWKDIPVVMITSRASDKHRQKAVELGASEYLVKPYEDTHLLGLIKNLTV